MHHVLPGLLSPCASARYSIYTPLLSERGLLGAEPLLSSQVGIEVHKITTLETGPTGTQTYSSTNSVVPVNGLPRLGDFLSQQYHA
jgi:hypothetical protein